MEISSVDLHSSIIFEILSRASLQTVGKCRLISKEIDNLTYESTFTNLHGERTKTIRGYFLQQLRNSYYKITFVSFDGKKHDELSLDNFLNPVDRGRSKIVASTKQGVLLLINNWTRPVDEYIVCRPGKELCRVIPNPKTRYPSTGFARIGMVVLKSNLLHFKIVRLTERSYGNRVNLHSPHCEVFDSNGLGSKKGQFHYPKEETWEISDLPISTSEIFDSMKLVNYKGSLGLNFLSTSEDCMELWVVTKQNTWTMEFSVNLPPLDRYDRPSFTGFCNADVAMMKSFNTLWFYNFKSSESKISINLDFSDEIFPIETDLESTNLPGSVRRDILRQKVSKVSKLKCKQRFPDGRRDIQRQEESDTITDNMSNNENAVCSSSLTH
ncbi:uncharacterized protein [Rutidosis leptorrhynchoides]|uniref:uncharacterized protein n=1 Tax=Rutidosis leptorrhynchoides TaxID=125765 RepID=UPI003A9A4D0A